MLALEVEYLSGVAFAAVGPDSEAPDWPPQPDRVFSALVATWALHGGEESEAGALRWLERLPPPRIVASDYHGRTAPVRFVPPNDPATGRSGDRTVMPHLRRRQPRRHPAARPHDPVVRFLWPEEPDDPVFAALQRLASDTAYVGHSASLTRCRFHRLDGEDGLGETRAPARRIYEGRFAELQRDFAAGRRPQPGDTARAPAVAPARIPQGVFSDRWLVLAHVEGEMPDLRACALVARAIRDALLSGYGRAGLPIPETVSGHAPDGSATRAPHLAVVPLPFAGFPHADGRVLGYALVPPGDGSLLGDADFRAALRGIASWRTFGGQRRRVIEVRAAHGRIRIRLSPTLEDGRASLDSRRYTKSARTFATVTPIVLDRHLKERGATRETEAAALVAAACRNAGLPEPARVTLYKHSAFEGVPSARPPAGAPAWMRWRLPATLASRALTHAVIEFAEEIAGPVLLGAGRFVGLGLCLPQGARRDAR